MKRNIFKRRIMRALRKVYECDFAEACALMRLINLHYQQGSNPRETYVEYAEKRILPWEEMVNELAQYGYGYTYTRFEKQTWSYCDEEYMDSTTINVCQDGVKIATFYECWVPIHEKTLHCPPHWLDEVGQSYWREYNY